jgi:hypothetical protein
MTTSPPRSIKPSTAGFSLAKVPRPRSPFNRRRRPFRPFFHRFGMPFMTSDDMNFIAFDDTAQGRCGFTLDDALTQLRGHFVDIVFMEIEFLGDLLIRQIESHQIQTENPLAQWLAMTGKDGVGQVIKIAVTGVAMIALAVALVFITAPFSHRGRLTPNTMQADRPAQLADGFVALGIVNKVIDFQHKRNMLGWDQFFKER